MKPTFQTFVQCEYGGVSLNAVALAASVFGASVFGLGRFVEAARAQTTLQTEISLPLGTVQVHLSDTARAEVEMSLRSMTDAELSLAYARIHAIFRDVLGQDDLSVARALCDYALLAEAEMQNRGIQRPSGTDSAGDMLLTYQLIL